MGLQGCCQDPAIGFPSLGHTGASALSGSHRLTACGCPRTGLGAPDCSAWDHVLQERWLSRQHALMTYILCPTLGAQSQKHRGQRRQNVVPQSRIQLPQKWGVDAEGRYCGCLLLVLSKTQTFFQPYTDPMLSRADPVLSFAGQFSRGSAAVSLTSRQATIPYLSGPLPTWLPKDTSSVIMPHNSLKSHLHKVQPPLCV